MPNRLWYFAVSAPPGPTLLRNACWAAAAEEADPVAVFVVAEPVPGLAAGCPCPVPAALGVAAGSGVLVGAGVLAGVGEVVAFEVVGAVTGVMAPGTCASAGLGPASVVVSVALPVSLTAPVPGMPLAPSSALAFGTPGISALAADAVPVPGLPAPGLPAPGLPEGTLPEGAALALAAPASPLAAPAPATVVVAALRLPLSMKPTTPALAGVAYECALTVRLGSESAPIVSSALPETWVSTSTWPLNTTPSPGAGRYPSPRGCQRPCSLASATMETIPGESELVCTRTSAQAGSSQG